jgi:hypothetical protein
MLQWLVGVRVQRRREVSSRRLQILAEDARMSCGDAEESKSRAFGRPTVLFPIPEGMDTDAHGTSETRLGQTDETPKGGNVVTGLESTLHQASANTRRNGSSKVATG